MYYFGCAATIIVFLLIDVLIADDFAAQVCLNKVTLPSHHLVPSTAALPPSSSL
jgi:hypothetical protein